MKFSLIVSTIGSYEEIKRLFKSLTEQEYNDFEVILIDQNKDGQVKELIGDYDLNIKYYKSKKGLSRGRNVAIDKIDGDIVAFPDDDCWYGKRTLSQVVKLFKKTNLDGVTVKSIDKDGKLSAGKESINRLLIDKRNVWNYAISYTMFLRAEVIRSIGYFDEELGVGAGTPWGSGEETDYLIRALNSDYNIKLIPDIFVYHPSTNLNKK